MAGNSIDASPTKNFFVEMLTRDIDLKDAILDLLDNCIDGIQRTTGADENSETPYSKYWAKIEISEDKFSIEDNCGGIPLEVARNYAFRMGRPNNITSDDDLYTIGTYGIGMKRAIFKMGRSANIFSQTESEAFRVTINPEWLSSDGDWFLPINDQVQRSKEENGTLIEVTQLREESEKQLCTTPFQNLLVSEIEDLYSYIIGKGFKIYFNSKQIDPRPLVLVWEGREKMIDKSEETVAPYLYEASRNDVSIELAIGFYRDLPTEEEIEDETQGLRRKSELAGWSIICNDRVVVAHDKTRLTGWGEATVPSYHPQFIAIAGTVHFKSKDAKKLPITTTKRGVDASSELYLYTKEWMREGLKTFTSYTNKWKTLTQRERQRTQAAQPVTPASAFEYVRSIDSESSKDGNKLWTSVKHSKFDVERRYIPKLPSPPESSLNKNKRISFSKPAAEIEIVSDYIFERSDSNPSEVGEACFEKILKAAKSI